MKKKLLRNLFAFSFFIFIKIPLVFAQTYSFNPDGSKINVEKIKFFNGFSIEYKKIKKDLTEKIIIKDNNGKINSNLEISDYSVNLLGIYPSKENAQIVFASSNCGGQICSDTMHAIYVFENKMIVNNFYPSNEKYSIDVNLKQKNIIDLKLNNLMGFDHYDELGDPKYFKYKFIQNIGFVNENFGNEFIKYVGIYPSEFLNNSQYRKPLVAAMGAEKFKDFRLYMDAASESIISHGRYIFFDGCFPHACFNKGAMVIDSVTGAIYVIWGDPSESTLKFDSTDSWNNEILDIFIYKAGIFDGKSDYKKSSKDKLIAQIKSSFTSKNVIAKNKNNQIKSQSIESKSTIDEDEIKITISDEDNGGVIRIIVDTNIKMSLLKIDEEVIKPIAEGKYIVKKLPKIGSVTTYNISAIDMQGKKISKSFNVDRKIISQNDVQKNLNPETIKNRNVKDSVAIIIGIADYKNLPKADYANDDARMFYDYATRGLGVKPENIKLLVDSDADYAEILKAFRTWLPTHVKSTTDVYVYYSGHGLASADGNNLYILPQRADRDLVEETGISFSKLNNAIQASKPKSVTIFIDSCYSGIARSGQSLIASARPLSLKANAQEFPSNFTVITASATDQISSSSPELKHGIFSYYLMRGMEGNADMDKDGKITFGEMYSYLSENIARQASLANRVQRPQFSGDANRVLVER